MISETHQREAPISIKQINMLTNDFRDFPTQLEEEIHNTILTRPNSYYGYILVPDTLFDYAVMRVLTYGDPQDKYFSQLTAQLELDFCWYDICGRHVMIWSKSQQITEMALGAIKNWLKKSWSDQLADECADWRIGQDPADKHS